MQQDLGLGRPRVSLNTYFDVARRIYPVHVSKTYLYISAYSQMIIHSSCYHSIIRTLDKRQGLRLRNRSPGQRTPVGSGIRLVPNQPTLPTGRHRLLAKGCVEDDVQRTWVCRAGF